MANILVCDDENELRTLLNDHLTDIGHHVIEAQDGEQCLNIIKKSVPDALLLDLKMPKVDGIEVLKELAQRQIKLPVLVITAFGAIRSAVEATKLGAVAYVQKPYGLQDITFQMEKAIKDFDRVEQIHRLKDKQSEGYGRLIGKSDAMQEVFNTLEKLRNVDAPTILITGESGTGKDLVAQMIHSEGRRSSGLFMEIDCASLPEQLVESELFGHEKGAFTDARQMKRGLFEVARGGTIFLDEIGEMPLTTQAKLLRALENRRFKRVGGINDISLDASVIVATNRNLQQRVADKLFREDLYFRLNVIPIRMPSLRERKSDIPAFVQHFIGKFNPRMDRKVESMSDEALQILMNYDWPGNVRELRNIIERIMILTSSQKCIEAKDLPAEILAKESGLGLPSSKRINWGIPDGGIELDAVEKDLILQALKKTNGNQSKASKLLGITRFALRYRMEKHHLQSASFKPTENTHPYNT